MPDITMAELKRKRDKREKQARFIGQQRMISGKLLADGSVTLAGAPTGKTWVRGSDDSREETAVWGYCGVANASIKISPNSSGEYEIVGVDYPEGVERMGGAVHIITAAPPLDEIVPHSINGGGFKPGRLEPSQLGGLNVHVSGFWHSGGLWVGGTITDGVLDPTTDDHDVSSFEPGTAGEVGWVHVYLDPATNTLDAVAGTPIFGEQQDLVEADIDVITLPVDVYPLGAFAFKNGMTALDGTTRMVDTRRHIESNATAGGGGSGASVDPIRTKSTTDLTTTSTTLVPIDATNIGYTQHQYTLASGDVVECVLTGEMWLSASSNYGFIDIEIDQPTSGDIYLNAASSSGTAAWRAWLDGNRDGKTVTLFFIATEAGLHQFRPVWRTAVNTLHLDGSSTPTYFTTKFLGQ